MRPLLYCLLHGLILSLAPGLVLADARLSSPGDAVADLVEQVHTRLQLMEFVAAWKHVHKLPVTDAPREQKVLDATVQQATELGIDAQAAPVRCGTQASFDTLAEIDRPQTRVLVNPGGTNEQFVRERLTHATVIRHPDNRTIFDELSAGRGDVMVTDDVEVELQTRRHPTLCRATQATFTRSDKAYLLAQDSAFAAAVDRWLTGELQSGAVERRLEAAFAQ